MEEAIRNPVILRTLGECLPFEDLKNARIVNKLWNRILNIEFRKRGLADIGSVTDRDDFLQTESALENQELLAKVHWRIRSHSVPAQTSLFNSLVAKSTWLLRVNRLVFYCYWEAEEVNRLIPFMLHCLPCLQEFYLQKEDTKLEPSIGVVLPGVPAEAEFSITCFEVDLNGEYFETTPLDPTFLRQCKKLKKFKVSIMESDKAVMDFFKLWKKVFVPSMRYDNVSFSLDSSASDIDDKKILCEAICEFINMNKPTKLRLLQFERLDFGYKTVDDEEFEASYHWTSAMSSKLQGTSIRSLVSTFPATCYWEDMDTAVHPDWTLSQLTKCKAFANVTKLTLKSLKSYSEDQWFNPTECRADEVTHNFEKVESLVIGEKYYGFGLGVIFCEPFGSFCGKIAPHLHNMTRLTITGIRLEEYDTFDEIFKELSQFQLQEVTFGIYQVAESTELIQTVRDKNDRGYFGGLSELTGKRLMLDTAETISDRQITIIMHMFSSGYEPHVALELEMYDTHWFMRNRKRRAELRLTVDQFKEALETVEAYWMNPLLCLM